MVEVSEALARLVWAVVSCDCAEVTDAWSAAIWLEEALADWSLDNLACAAVSEDWAALAVAWRADGSTVASVWPARDRLAGAHVDAGDRARDAEVQVGLLGGFDGPGR